MEAEKSLNLREQLNRLTVMCRYCRQMWLAPGLANDEEYVCKECGTSPFMEKPSVAQPQHDNRLC